MGRMPKTLKATKSGIKGKNIFKEINGSKIGLSHPIMVEYTKGEASTRIFPDPVSLFFPDEGGLV
jgi:hypothetical protein